MKLNLGSGLKKLPDFINIDHDISTNPDYCLELGKDVLPLQENSVTYVQAHHVFEHIGSGFFSFLQDLYRVCQDQTVIDVQVPHPRHDYFLGDLTHVRAITIENMRPLSKKWCQTQSYINSSWSGLATQLSVDFEIIEHKYILDDSFKQIIANIKTDDEINWMARAMNNSISEIHFTLMAIKQ